MNKKIDIKDLPDLVIEELPNGFSIIFEGDKPVAAIAKYEYYQYINKLISKVKEYVQNKTDK